MTVAYWQIGVALFAFALTVRVLLYYRERALYFRACKNAQVEESLRLARIIRQGEAAHRKLEVENGVLRHHLEQLTPTDEQINRWMEAAR